MDGSGADPHTHFMHQFGDRAGQRSGAKERLLKPALALRSTMDTVMLGHDIDGSGDAGLDEMLETLHTGAAGMRASEGRERPKKRVLPVASVMDAVVHNGDLNSQPAQDFFNGFQEHAGTRTYALGRSNRARCKSSPSLGTASPSVSSARGPREGRYPEPTGTPQSARQTDFTHGRMARTLKPEDLQPKLDEYTPPGTPSRAPMSIVPQRVNPFGQQRRPSSCSSVSSLSNTGGRAPARRIGFDDGASQSSLGSTRPKWQR